MVRCILISFVAIFVGIFGAVADVASVNCGTGYVLVDTGKKTDGIRVAECQKVWCRDLETGDMMGRGNKANSGYQTTSGYGSLCDANGECVECWGARKWCAGEARGEWNPEYGAYTRGGDNVTYQSYRKGSCFAWRLEKPDCAAGESAILKDGKWVCVVEGNKAKAMRASGLRRTGTIRRIK